MKKSTRPSRKRAFVVDRRKWGRGDNVYWSRLINEGSTTQPEDKGMMCCLGFVGITCAIPRKMMRGVGSPGPSAYKHPTLIKKWPKWLLDKEGDDTPEGQQAMKINDDKEISDKMREYKLKRLFKKHGCSIRFTH